MGQFDKGNEVNCKGSQMIQGDLFGVIWQRKWGHL